MRLEWTRLFTKNMFRWIPLSKTNSRDCGQTGRQVTFYFKLPDWFKIPTPIGNIIPVGSLYSKMTENLFRYETKDTGTPLVDISKLRESERQKIKCGAARISKFDGLGIPGGEQSRGSLGAIDRWSVVPAQIAVNIFPALCCAANMQIKFIFMNFISYYSLTQMVGLPQKTVWVCKAILEGRYILKSSAASANTNRDLKINDTLRRGTSWNFFPKTARMMQGRSAVLEKLGGPCYETGKKRRDVAACMSNTSCGRSSRRGASHTGRRLKSCTESRTRCVP